MYVLNAVLTWHPLKTLYTPLSGRDFLPISSPVLRPYDTVVRSTYHGMSVYLGLRGATLC
jgi:hypothetical protein